MSFDYSVLRGNIRSQYRTESNFAKALGISHDSLSRKLNNKTEFTQKEIMKSKELLGLDSSGILENFFKH